MAQPKVSIVIPVYKPAHFFLDLLYSIRKQTFKDFEVIISDDFPEDGNVKKMLDQVIGLSVKYIINPASKGIFNNLNNAIRHSSGEYVQIFCQDDLMSDFFLNAQLDTFRQYPTAGLVFSKYIDIDGNNNTLPDPTFLSNEITQWEPFIPSQKAINCLFAFGCLPGNLSPVMLKREVIEKTGFFDEQFPFAGDFDYWIRVAQQYAFAYNKTTGVQVRTHNSRASESLGVYKLIPDVRLLYKKLYALNTVKAIKLKKHLQVNNMAVTLFLRVLGNILKGKLGHLKLLRQLNSFPYFLPTIFLVLIYRRIRGKFTWFIAESQC